MEELRPSCWLKNRNSPFISKNQLLSWASPVNSWCCGWTCSRSPSIPAEIWQSTHAVAGFKYHGKWTLLMCLKIWVVRMPQTWQLVWILALLVLGGMFCNRRNRLDVLMAPLYLSTHEIIVCNVRSKTDRSYINPAHNGHQTLMGQNDHCKLVTLQFGCLQHNDNLWRLNQWCQ